MKRKNRSLIILIAIFVVLTAAGGIYSWAIQGKALRERDKQLKTLRASYAQIEAVDFQLKQLRARAMSVDSVLFRGLFALPQNLLQSEFYRFIDLYSGDVELYTYTNTEFVNRGVENGFPYYTYKVFGLGTFDNVYGLIYAIEHSKELKKIQSADISGMTSVDSKANPHYLVKFTLEVRVYFSESDQYASLKHQENNLSTRSLHNAFYPLVRNEIPRNTRNLPDVQNATLLSLVPQGAYFLDSKGKTLFLQKGDPVYLGYLADIDYENESVTFTLDKGGVIEDLILEIGKKHNKQGK